MKKIVIFLICLFCCFKCFSFPADNEILKLYPTLKTFTYQSTFTFYYSENIVELLPEEKRIEGRILKFRNMENTFLCVEHVHSGINDIWISSDGSIIISEQGRKVIITDSGNIYIDKQFYPYKVSSIEKYQITKGTILRIPQVFYYVGLEQNTKSAFSILQEPKENSVIVANIAVNTKVEVIGVKGNPDGSWKFGDEMWVLIKSGIGLTGWVKAFSIAEWQANYEPGFLPIFDQSYP